MTIACDIDDTLADTLLHVNTYYNKLYRTSFTLNDFHHYNWWEIWGCSKDRAVTIFESFITYQSTKILPPKEGAIEGIKKISSKEKIVAVTSRTHNLCEPTQKWLEQHFPNLFAAVLYGNQYSTHSQETTKPELCKKINARIIIEDQLLHALACAEKNIPVILLDTPWNQHKNLPKNITRAFSWDEIVTATLTRNKRI